MDERGLTVRAVLALEVFTRVETTIVTGHHHLGREVRWVHFGEIPDLGDHLRGGEMVLTAGLGMGHSRVEHRAFVRRIAEAGASVIVVELSGRVFATMPPAVIEEADSWGLPLVGLSAEIPFVEVSAQIHEVLAAARTATVEAEEEISRSFLDSLLSDADPVALCRTLADMTGGLVVLEDVTRQIVTYDDRTEASEAVVVDWDRHSRVGHGEGRHLCSTTASREDGSREWCCREPVVVRGDTWGWLHLLPAHESAAGRDRFAVRRAAGAVAVSLLGERARGAYATQRQSALLARLMLGDLTGPEFVAGARRLGKDLSGGHLIVVTTTRHENFDENDLVRALTEAGAGPIVIGDLGEELVAVARSNGELTIHALGAPLRTRDVRAGFAPVDSVARLKRSIEESRLALEVAASGPDDAPIVDADSLGVLKLILAAASGSELGRYVEGELGALLTNDSRSGNQLLPTLAAYLRHDGNKSEAARELYVQRRTLYYRLERIERVAQCDLKDPEVRLRLNVALRALKVLRRRGASVAPST